MLLAGLQGGESPSGATKPAATGMKPALAGATNAVPSAAAIDAAMAHGVTWLIEHQNPHGSWGSARRTKDLNIFAPVPGAHDAFRCGVTALAVQALIDERDLAVRDAVTAKPVALVTAPPRCDGMRAPVAVPTPTSLLFRRLGTFLKHPPPFFAMANMKTLLPLDHE